MNTLMRIGCLVGAVLLGVRAPIVSTAEVRGRAEPVLLFGIGMHIEPLGRTAQGYGGGGADYRQGPLFERHVQDILAVTGIVEAHGGRMTIQAQSPFTQVAIERGNTILKDLESRGHEIGLHFHEDAHLGRDSGRLPPEIWCAVMQEEIGFIYQAGVRNHIRYWSGGNLYPGVLDAAACAGLDVNSDWKNPRTQSTDPSLLGVNPWRPLGGPSETDLSKFAAHDSNGKIVFLPEGMYDPEKFARKREIIAQGGDRAWFDVLREALERSLASARADRVNVFHFTVHPGEFRGDPAEPFKVIEDFLTSVVDPLVTAGKVRWATFSQMADEFIAWEKAYPGVDPRLAASSAQLPRPTEPDVTYCVMDGVELKLDIYRPRESTAPTPALLYVHGGGWTSGDKARGEGVRDIPELVARSYVVAAVNYRLAPRYKFPAMIQDVKCAVRFLRANAERYNINPDKIGVWGGSAGGHLAALLGTADETAGWEVGQYLEHSSRVQAVVDMFGPTDLTVLFEGANPRLMEQVFGTSDRSSEALKRASPVNWVSSDDPPFLILHGERDSLVPVSQSQIFYEKLQAADVPAMLVIVKNAGHGFVPMGGPIDPSREELTRMIADFFDHYLKRPVGSDRYGVSQGAHRDATLMPRSFELAGQAGIGWVRFGIWYGIVSPRPGVFRYEESGFDAQVRKARQEGLQILGKLAFATSWNTSAPPNLPPEADPTHFPPRDYRAWADYVFQTVSRYKEDIQYWEVWNEPDLLSFWAGTPAQYAELLAVTYEAVKRANPQAKVVLGGLALGGRRVNPNFLIEILSDARYPAARYFDIMNFHHYGSREEARQRMEYVRNALRQVGASDKPIWITETGYSSDPSQQDDPNYRGLEGQAQWLRDMIPYLLTDLGADKVFWYRLYDYPADFNADVGARYHGLIDNQGNPKPSYFAYKELIASAVSPIGFTLTYSEENQQLFDDIAQPDDRLLFFRAHVLTGKGWPPRLTRGKVLTTWPSWTEARQYEDRWAPYADVFGYDIEADSPPDETRDASKTIQELRAYLDDVSRRYGHPIKLSIGLNYNFGTRHAIALARSDEVHLHANELLRAYLREDPHGLNYVEWLVARAAEVRAVNPDVDIVIAVLVPEMETVRAVEVAQALLSAMAAGRLRFEGFTLWADADAAKNHPELVAGGTFAIM